MSIEADIWLAQLLRRTRNLPAYAGKDIRVIPVAIAECDSTACFSIASRGRASNSQASAGGRSTMGGEHESQYVPTLTLDSLLSTMPAPGFVKIDVEGAELLAIRGALKIIKEIRPIFYIEVGPLNHINVSSILEACGYVAMLINGESPLPGSAIKNIFFIPNEKERQVSGVVNQILL